MLRYRFWVLIVAGQVWLLASGAARAVEPATAPTTQPTTQAAMQYDDAIWKIALGQKRLTIQEVLDPEFWRRVLSQLAVDAISLVPRVLVAMLFLVAFWLIYRGLRRVLIGGMTKAHMDSSIREMLSTLLKWAVMGFGVVIACNQIGIQITALLTGVSIIGLAIGFAAQETLSNFIAGVVIFWDRPFRVGDWVEIDGVLGQVLRITFRSTRMLGGDGEVVVLPNTQMLSHRLNNHSANPINRVRVPIGIAYKESIDQARQILLALTADDTRVRHTPAPSVVVTACADSSVNMELRFWVSDKSIEKAMYFEYLEKVKKALDAAGIEIPFPHRQLLVEETPLTRGLVNGGIRQSA